MARLINIEEDPFTKIDLCCASLAVTADTAYDIFLFQAEAGIRDVAVTGVQTCALPICALPTHRDGPLRPGDHREAERRRARRHRRAPQEFPARGFRDCWLIAHVTPPPVRELGVSDQTVDVEAARRGARPRAVGERGYSSRRRRPLQGAGRVNDWGPDTR